MGFFTIESRLEHKQKIGMGDSKVKFLKRIKSLSDEQKRKVSVARNLGIPLSSLSGTEIITDGGGHFMGIQATVFIYTDRAVVKWVENNLPMENDEWSKKNLTEEYFSKIRKT